MATDLADLQSEHGKAMLNRVLIKMGSPYRMGKKIENLTEDLKMVSHQIIIRSFLICVKGNNESDSCSVQKRRPQLQSELSGNCHFKKSSTVHSGPI